MRHSLLNTRICPRRLAAPPGFVTLTKFQVEPPVQGIDAHSKDLGHDIKSFARVTAFEEVPSSTMVVLWHPHPFEWGEYWDEINDEGPQHHSWSQRVPLGVGLAAADGGGTTAGLKEANESWLLRSLDAVTRDSAKE